MADVLFKSGTYADYIGLAAKDDNTIYFKPFVYEFQVVFIVISHGFPTKILSHNHFPQIVDIDVGV